jgi:membrane dipeptidase
MGIEGGHAIEDNIRLLRDYYDLGIRYMTLTHSNTNDWADSSGDVNDPNIKHHNGLTELGKDIVREMNRLGMMVDISHVADKTFWDALEVSKAPIFASHSSCRALTNHARNMTDDMIVALAKKGGVVQVNFYCGFISQKFRDNDAADTKALDARMARETAGKNLSEPDRQILSEKLRMEMRLSRATLADVVDHIDHIRKIAGIDAIGIGGDFDGVSCTPAGLDDVSKYPNLTRALLEKGYSADDIRKIYGGNFLRVMRAVEAAAGK